MTTKFPKFVPEKQSLDNYLELMNVAFTAADITDEAKKVSLILTHIPTNYFDDVMSLIAPKVPSALTLVELSTTLKQLFKPKSTLVKCLSEFQDRTKLKTENYNNFFKDLNRLAELCEFGNKDEFLKYKLFLAARNEQFFTAKLADFDYEANTVGDLLIQLQNLEAAYLDSSGIQPVNKISNKCSICGRKNHDNSTCRFKDATCFKCRKKGHISSNCKSNVTDVRKEKDTVPNKTKWSKKKKINLVDEEISGKSNSSDEEEVTLNTIKMQKVSSKPILVQAKIDKRSVTFEVDTGSPVSTLMASEVKGLALQKANVKLEAYNGSTIDVLGTINIKNFKYNNICLKNVNFLVVDRACSNNLLGRDLIEKLNLIPGIKNLNFTNVDNIVEGYKIDNTKPIKNFVAELYPRPNHSPSFQKARTLPFSCRPKVEEAIDKLVESDYLEKVEFSDYAAPIVPVCKKDNSIRICGDFRKINQILHETIYPIPHMADLITKVAGHKFYSKIDLKNAYLQIQVSDESQKFLVINTHLGLYKYKRLPFGIHSAPAIFQKFISLLLLNVDGCFPYLDDIIIYSDTKQDHDTILSKVLNLLQKNNVDINFKKCEFYQNKIDYLGFVLTDNGYEADPQKVKAIVSAPVPTNTTEVKSVMGMMSFYSSFIKNFAIIAAPLYDLTKKNVKFVWSNKAQKAFEILKSKISDKVVLSRFDSGASLIVEVDASPVGVGAVLLQKHKNNEVSTLFFASRKLSDTEQRYSQIDREALSIVFAINKFEKFLLGRKFVLRTDHRPLTHIFNPSSTISKTSNARLVRWSLLLSSFDYQIEFIAGNRNNQADFLSRLPIHDDSVKFSIPIEFVNLINSIEDISLDISNLKLAAHKDSVLNTVKEFVKNGFPNINEVLDPNVKEYFKLKNDLSIINDFLTYRNRIVIPDTLRKNVMDILHVGHAGSAAMKSQARDIVFWPHIDNDIDKITKNCTECFTNHIPKGTFVSKWPETNEPWQRLHVDWAGPMEGNYFLVIFDPHSKFLDVHSSTSLTSKVTIDLLRKTFSNFGLPLELVSDNGPCFISHEFKDFLLKNKIKQTLIAPYHPQSNGAGERAVKTFKNLFSKFKKGSLSKRLARLLYHYRSTVQASINKTPAELLFNRKFRTLLDVFKPEITWSKNNNSNNSKFVIGEAVFAKNFGKGPEWLAGTVVAIVNSLNYKIRFDCDSNVVCVRHASQLFTRELINSQNHDVPTLNDDQENLFKSNNRYSNNSNVLFNAVDQSVNNDISENVEASDVIENREPVNLSVDNEPITDSNELGYRTRSGRLSKPPIKLNL